MEDNRQAHCWKELQGQTLTASTDKDRQALAMVQACLLDVIIHQGKACSIHLRILTTEIASYRAYTQASPWLMNVELIGLVIAVNWI
jgi:hypothetical protein